MTRISTNRVAIVTGAGRGIGREHALELARRGCAVLVNDLGSTADGFGHDASPAQEVADAIRAAGGQAAVSGADISDWAGAERLVQQALETFGRLDVLVNNAGILRDRMLVSMTAAEWDDVIAVHLRGTAATSHFAAAHWRSLAKKSGRPMGARIINTTSPSGLYGNASQGNYGAAKAGIAALTLISAMELAPYGVTVNAIAPAAWTRMTAGLVTNDASDRGAHHIAPLVAWLAGPDSGAVTGRVFDVRGPRIGVVESWRLGPTTAKDGVWTVEELDAVIPDLVATAAPNVGMDGLPVPGAYAGAEA